MSNTSHALALGFYHTSHFTSLLLSEPLSSVPVLLLGSAITSPHTPIHNYIYTHHIYTLIHVFWFNVQVLVMSLTTTEQQQQPSHTTLRRSLTRSSSFLKSCSHRLFRNLFVWPSHTSSSSSSSSSLAFEVVDYDSILSFICASSGPINVAEINSGTCPDKVYNSSCLTVREVEFHFPLRSYREKEGGATERKREECLVNCKHLDFEKRMGVCDCEPPLSPHSGSEAVELKYTDCPICLEPFSDSDGVRVLPCGHVYHDQCVRSWLVTCHADCPSCRQDFLALVPIRW